MENCRNVFSLFEVSGQAERALDNRTTVADVLAKFERFVRECVCVCVFNRLKIFSEESVPLFGPPLPSPPVFTDHQEFRDFLLVKCKCLSVLQPLCACVCLCVSLYVCVCVSLRGFRRCKWIVVSAERERERGLSSE